MNVIQLRIAATNRPPVVTIFGNAVPNARLLKPATIAASSGRNVMKWIEDISPSSD